MAKVELWPYRITLKLIAKKSYGWLRPRDEPTFQIWWQSIQGDFWANGWNITFCDLTLSVRRRQHVYKLQFRTFIILSLPSDALFCRFVAKKAKKSRVFHNWRDPWKNRLCSTTMKLRKSLVKPVTRQNISSCSVLPPEIVMQDTFNVVLWTSADICVVHDDLRWKNRTTHHNCRFSASSLALRVIFSGGTTKQHVVIGFGELAAVD